MHMQRAPLLRQFTVGRTTPIVCGIRSEYKNDLRHESLSMPVFALKKKSEALESPTTSNGSGPSFGKHITH